VPEECFPVLWCGQVAVVRTPEEVDATIADAMREALLSVLNQGASALVVDMTRTTFCDSAGVSAMARARRRGLASNAEVRIATRSPALLRLFSLLGLEPAIAVYPDVEAALSSLGGTNHRLDCR
jgi:anti-sigma B factor antagonist